MLNLIDGERGLISYFEKKNMIANLSAKENMLQKKLNFVEKKNNMLTNVIDLDFLETIYRQKFMVGKKEEKVFVE